MKSAADILDTNITSLTMLMKFIEQPGHTNANLVDCNFFANTTVHIAGIHENKKDIIYHCFWPDYRYIGANKSFLEKYMCVYDKKGCWCALCNMSFANYSTKKHI